jgi:hypothetical protein
MGILAATTVLIDGPTGIDGPRPVGSPWLRAGSPST